MPELPDVETFRKYLSVTSLHKKVAKVHIPGKKLLKGLSATTLRRHLKGRKLVDTARHGKYLFAATDRGDWLVLHFGMTGKLKYYMNKEKEPAHTRLLLVFRNGYHLAYDDQRKLGTISLVRDMNGFIKRRELGPDALRIDPEAFRDSMGGKRGSVKAALMDQHTISGIGNVYADEILYQAGVNPESSLEDLEDSDIDRIYRNMMKVLNKAIDCRADPECLPDTYLIPSREKGGVCPECGEELERTQVSGRTTYFCPCRQGA